MEFGQTFSNHTQSMVDLQVPHSLGVTFWGITVSMSHSPLALGWDADSHSPGCVGKARHAAVGGSSGKDSESSVKSEREGVAERGLRKQQVEERRQEVCLLGTSPPAQLGLRAAAPPEASPNA